MARKSKPFKITCTVLAAVFAAYVGYQVYRAKTAPVQTEMAISAVDYDTISTPGFVVRNEQVLTAPSAQGVLVPRVSEAGKIESKGEIAQIFPDESTAQNYAKSMQLKEELAYYNSLEMQSLGEASDIDSVDKNIREKINQTVLSGEELNFTNSAAVYQELNDALLRRQLLTGVKIDFSEKKKALQSQISALEKSGTKSLQQIAAEASGNFSSAVDGLETAADYSKVNQLTVSQAESLLKRSGAEKPAGAFGKIVKDFNWYLVCVVENKKALALKEGQKLTVSISGSSQETVETVVYSRLSDTAASEKCVLVLKCSEMNANLISLRQEELEIRLKSYEGLRVSKEALRSVDGQQGVYVLISNKVTFRKVEVLYTGKKDVIVKLDNTDRKSIQLYDQVITQGKDLYDGKIVN